MPTNDFKAFATGSNAAVMTNAEWAALGDLVSGFPSGRLPSTKLNKVLRQSTIMAAVLAQYIMETTGQNAVDDGSTNLLVTLLKRSMGRGVVVTPIVAGSITMAANATRISTCATFTAPCDGVVNAWYNINLAGVAAGPLSAYLTVNGTVVAQDAVPLSQARNGNPFAVTAGTTVTISLRVVSDVIAPGVLSTHAVGGTFQPT